MEQSCVSILSVWELQMTIIGILMWMMQCSQSHAWGVCSRMALGGDDEWQSNKINVSEYHHVNNYNSYGFIFSAWVQNILNILCHFVFREYWICVCGLCQHFVYRVQGHGHITLQSMCNVWTDEMWNMVGIEILLFFSFTVGDRKVALNIIARCSITQTPTGQSKVWWLHARKMVVIYLKRI